MALPIHSMGKAYCNERIDDKTNHLKAFLSGSLIHVNKRYNKVALFFPVHCVFLMDTF